MRVRHSTATLLVFAALIAAAFHLPLPGAVSEGGPAVFLGRVVDMGSGSAIVGARITAGGASTVTDEKGWYRLSVAAGMFDLHADHPLYIGMARGHARVAARQETRIDLEMIPRSPTGEQAEIIDEKMMQPSSTQGVPLSGDGADGTRVLAATGAKKTIRVLMPDGIVVVMDLDEYLKGVVPHEVPAYWPMATLRAQAIAARSYAVTRRGHAGDAADVCTTTHCQVWSPTHFETTDRAVDETHGVFAVHDGVIIHAYFSAHCDGRTRNSESVWGGYLPYCRSVACPCGYTFLYGHGVGMCQQGARVLGERGYSHQEILQHYYTGIQVFDPAPATIGDAGVRPLVGDVNTQFSFEAEYRSDIGDPPIVANVLVDGEAFALDRVATAPGGGWLYRLLTRLSLGSHLFRFHFDDGYAPSQFVPADTVIDGPVVVEPDPLTPTPTSVPTPLAGVRVHDVTDSTVDDWMLGEGNGLVLSEANGGGLLLAQGGTQGTWTSSVVTTPLSFVALGVTWHVDEPMGSRVKVAVRRRAGDGQWRAWENVERTEDERLATELATSDLLFGQSLAYQYRLRLESGGQGQSPTVWNVRWTAIGVAAEVTPGTTTTVPHTKALTGRPAPIPRTEWGAPHDSPLWPNEKKPVRALILHHASDDDVTVDPSAMARAMYYYDAVVLGLGDIRYNYLVDRLGNVYEGRAGGPGTVAAHAGLYDWGSVGIALLGDPDGEGSPGAMVGALSEFLAWQCGDHGLHPMGDVYLIDARFPTIMSHRECGAMRCPGGGINALLPAIREETLRKMSGVPPRISLERPKPGQVVGGIVSPGFTASPVITRADYIVDGALMATKHDAALGWKWNTTTLTDAEHTLRVVVSNAGGQAIDEVSVRVDNTPPKGTVGVPHWSRSRDVPFSMSDTDSVAVQFSNGWVWEGEDLEHYPGTGRVISDTAAANGLAWKAVGGVDQAGPWHGPYTCDLPPRQEYSVCYQLKSTAESPAVGLATLDVADNQGLRVYLQRTLVTDDLATANAYNDVCLELAYGDRYPTCQTPDPPTGLEFRTWFSGQGHLSLDRVTVFGPRIRPVTSTVLWRVNDTEGAQKVTVRLLDEAANHSDHNVTVRLDRLPPEWIELRRLEALVRDVGSGLAPTTAEWSSTPDGGTTWSAWESVAVTATRGITGGVWLAAPPGPVTHIRFRVEDVAGNQSESPPIDQLATPTPTLPFSPTLTSTPSATPSSTHTVAPTVPAATPTPSLMPARCVLPLVLKPVGD